jgi:glycosyltransferase involved in cell wall biosynthesis
VIKKSAFKQIAQRNQKRSRSTADAGLVVHVVSQYPPALGGMETAVHAIAHEQYKTGIPVQVITSDQGTDKSTSQDEGFLVNRLRSFVVANTPIMPGLAFRLFCLARSSTVHLHIAQAYTPELVWIFCRLRGIKYVAHFHADVIPSGRGGLLLEPYKKIVLSHVMRDAFKVLVPTDDYKDLVADRYGILPERIAVVDNGTNHYLVDQPKSLPEKTETAKLIFVGRLAVQKNLPLLLQAIAAYRDKYGTKIQLSIVGDGDLRPAVESEIQQLKLDSLAHLIGARYGAELESVYEDSDLLVLTSVFESFGLVLVEAMAKALPIVSVYIPAVRNVVRDGVNGLLVESTPEALANAIHRMLTDKEFYGKVSANNLSEARRYTWRAVVDKISAAYRPTVETSVNDLVRASRRRGNAR